MKGESPGWCPQWVYVDESQSSGSQLNLASLPSGVPRFVFYHNIRHMSVYRNTNQRVHVVLRDNLFSFGSGVYPLSKFLLDQVLLGRG